MHLSLPAVRRAWRHPARAPGLGTGMPLVCGTRLAPALFGALPWGGYAAVGPAIAPVRPVSLLLSLVRSRSDRREQPVGAWFGPEGFASMVCGLLVLVLQAGIPPRPASAPRAPSTAPSSSSAARRTPSPVTPATRNHTTVPTSVHHGPAARRPRRRAA
ncbi:hypothetical protein [Streptomyces sp. NPDC001380]|uniref:hypothetical protein n=1 Tax=Streptomyces sp. NPDC001380 TaxID=3364566 RepID=UPI003686D42B